MLPDRYSFEIIGVKPDGAKPEWFAIETEDLLVFAWDYELGVATKPGFDPGDTGV